MVILMKFNINEKDLILSDSFESNVKENGLMVIVPNAVSDFVSEKYPSLKTYTPHKKYTEDSHEFGNAFSHGYAHGKEVMELKNKRI